MMKEFNAESLLHELRRPPHVFIRWATLEPQAQPFVLLQEVKVSLAFCPKNKVPLFFSS